MPPQEILINLTPTLAFKNMSEKSTLKNKFWVIHFNTHIRKLNEAENIHHSTFRNNSLYNPQVHDGQQIEVFKRLVLEDLKALKLRKGADSVHIKEYKH